MYSVHAYGKMLKDTIRMAAYQQALQRAVKPGMIVLDIGTGTGIHALMAAKLGAKHVYAIEPADSITLAPTIARHNDCADTITFIQDYSTRIDLPEKADLLVSDLHGTLPWFQQHIPTIADARRRLLKEDGILIPRRDTVFIVPVEAPPLYAHYSEPWRQNPYDFDFSYVSERITNNYSRGRADREAFLTTPQQAVQLDYRTIEDPNVHLRLTFEAERNGTMHGFIVWFDTDVSDEVGLTSAPYEPEISYGSSFFPLTHPVEVSAGDSIRIEWRGILQDDYVWMWNCTIEAADGIRRASYKQNSLQGAFMSMDSLRKRAPAYQPNLNTDGKIDRAILNLMSDGHTVADIASEVANQFGDELRDEKTALERVRRLSQQYG